MKVFKKNRDAVYGVAAGLAAGLGFYDRHSPPCSPVGGGQDATAGVVFREDAGLTADQRDVLNQLRGAFLEMNRFMAVLEKA